MKIPVHFVFMTTNVRLLPWYGVSLSIRAVVLVGETAAFQMSVHGWHHMASVIPTDKTTTATVCLFVPAAQVESNSFQQPLLLCLFFETV